MSCCIVISCSSNITTLPVYPVIEFATITGNGDSVAAPQIALDLLNIGGTFNNFDGFTRKTENFDWYCIMMWNQNSTELW